jgi:hypothetical protein
MKEASHDCAIREDAGCDEYDVAGYPRCPNVARADIKRIEQYLLFHFIKAEGIRCLILS